VVNRAQIIDQSRVQDYKFMHELVAQDPAGLD